MPFIEATCSLIKNDGKVIGVSLVAEPQTEAEMFCARLPKRIEDGSATIHISSGMIVFIDQIEAEYVLFEIGMEDAAALKSLFDDQTISLGLYSDGILCPGFKITHEGMQNDGEKHQLQRIERSAISREVSQVLLEFLR